MEYYLKRIRRDEIDKRLTDLAIVHNPNAKDPKKLFRMLQNALHEIEGKAYLFKKRMTGEDEQKLRRIAQLMKENAAKRRGNQ